MYEALTFITWIVCGAHTCVVEHPDRTNLTGMMTCRDATRVKELYENRYDLEIVAQCDIPSVPLMDVRPMARPWTDQ